MAPTLCLNSRMMVYGFDGEARQPMLICELPTKEPDAPARYLLPAVLVDLLKQFNGIAQTDVILHRYVASHKQYSVEKLSSLVQEYFVRKGLLLPEGRDFSPEASFSKRRSYMYLKKTLLPARVVSFLSRPVSWLFYWKVVLALVPAFIATQVIYFMLVFSKYHFNLNNVNGVDLVLLMLLTSFLGLFHELGHAAALNHFGYQRATIGWGLYLSLTVFYTDLSDAWRLKRLERALVDVGGIYFHCITLIFLLVLVLRFQIPALVYCFFFVDLQIAGSLNPFLRMDGYWLVSDLFGIADLRRECLTVIEQYFWRFVGRETKLKSHLAHLSRRNRVFVALYLACGAAFSTYIYKVLFAQLAFIVLPAYPRLLATFWMTAITTPGHILTLLNLASGILFRGLMLYGFFRMIYGAICRVCKWMVRTFHTYRSAVRTVAIEVN
jgi:putative peptide zinc metalloprotease protein